MKKESVKSEIESKKTAEEFKALISAGNGYDKKGDKNKAIAFYKKAYKLNKNSSIPFSNIAISLYEMSQFDDAKKYAEKALKISDKNTSSLIILGNIEYKNKDYLKALEWYLKAYNLHEENVVSVVNVANTYFEIKDYENAIIYTKKAIELSPDDAWSYNNLSQLYQKIGENEKAVEAGYKAVNISDEDGRNSHHINLGYMLYEISIEDRELSVRYTEQWLKKYSYNNVVNYMAKSILNDEVLDRANDEYLKNIFDVFASDFERVLKDLDYKAPELINDFLLQIYGKKTSKKLKILDAGCGTGLCGKYLKKYAGIFGLHGVDISSEMIAEAKRKRIYNKLFVEELISFLSSRKNEYDLVVSTDVFIYFGDLENLFLNLNNILKKNGRVIFSVSENPKNDGIKLHASGRFSHGRNYIENLIEKTGFDLENISREHIRNEGDSEVIGFIISMVKKQL
ncbi:MAG: methyltransferase domain-containing protein [Lactobacillaceae bacterium]|jgi:predicted TPR repeat methyltransferase|nr:methyltransferase domain-containing protein [Lactobacillaceae bacterium]